MTRFLSPYHSLLRSRPLIQGLWYTVSGSNDFGHFTHYYYYYYYQGHQTRFQVCRQQIGYNIVKKKKKTIILWYKIIPVQFSLVFFNAL